MMQRLLGRRHAVLGSFGRHDWAGEAPLPALSGIPAAVLNRALSGYAGRAMEHAGCHMSRPVPQSAHYFQLQPREDWAKETPEDGC